MSSDAPWDSGHGPSGNERQLGSASDECGELLLGIADGDAAAFEDLFVLQSRTLMAVILRVVKSRSLAEEVLQECFTEVWTHCNRFDPGRGTGRAWLVTLCRRRAIDCVRRVQAERDRDVAEGRRSAAETAALVEQDVISRWESDLTLSALKALPEAQAQPIVMAFYQGLTHAQISAHLKVPLGTIKSRIRDGMRKLREELEVSHEYGS